MWGNAFQMELDMLTVLHRMHVRVFAKSDSEEDEAALHLYLYKCIIFGILGVEGGGERERHLAGD